MEWRKSNVFLFWNYIHSPTFIYVASNLKFSRNIKCIYSHQKLVQNKHVINMTPCAWLGEESKTCFSFSDVPEFLQTFICLCWIGLYPASKTDVKALKHKPDIMQEWEPEGLSRKSFLHHNRALGPPEQQVVTEQWLTINYCGLPELYYRVCHYCLSCCYPKVFRCSLELYSVLAGKPRRSF